MPTPRKLRYEGTPLLDNMLKEIANMTAQGWTAERIGRHGRVRMSAGYVRRVQKRPEFQAILDEVRKPIQERVITRLLERAERAAGKIVEIMENGTPGQKVQFEAAKEVLYMIGVKPINVVENRNVDINPEHIESAKLTLTELEETYDRLSKRESTFILKKDTPATIAPVTTPEPEPTTPTDEPSLTTSAVGQEAVTA